MIRWMSVFLLSFSVLSCQTPPAALSQLSPGIFKAEGFNSSGGYSLAGTWLSSPSRLGETSSPQPVPGGWGVQGPDLAGGSHFLSAQVVIPGASGMWTLELPNIFCAYRLWVNGRLVHTQGIHGDQGWEGYTEDVHPSLASFLWQGDRTEILLEVANFTNQKGGIQGPVFLAPSAAAQFRWKQENALNHFMAGISFFLFLFHLFQYLAIRLRKADLYLAFISFFVFFRVLLTGQKIISWVLSIPFELHYDLEFATVFFIVHFLTLYIRSLFPKEWMGKLTWPFILLNLAFGLLLLPLDNATFVRFFDYYPLVILPLMGLNLTMVFRAYIHQHSGSRILMGAIVGMILIGMSDVAFAVGLHTLGSFSSFGFLIFLLVQFYLLLSRSAWEEHQALKIAGELQEKNHQQSQFMANTSHELKTPLHGLLGMSDLLARSPDLPEEVRSELEVLAEELRHLNGEMDRLLGTDPKPGP